MNLYNFDYFRENSDCTWSYIAWIHASTLTQHFNNYFGCHFKISALTFCIYFLLFFFCGTNSRTRFNLTLWHWHLNGSGLNFFCEIFKIMQINPKSAACALSVTDQNASRFTRLHPHKRRCAISWRWHGHNTHHSSPSSLPSNPLTATSRHQPNEGTEKENQVSERKK